MKTSELKNTFQSLVENYTNNHLITEKLWNEILKNYSHKNRHYHTLQHLENLLLKINPIKEKFQNWNMVLFALFYHDMIYNSLKSDNEERSADFARERLTSLNISSKEIEICSEIILSTKNHTFSSNSDINYFTDADLICIRS